MANVTAYLRLKGPDLRGIELFVEREREASKYPRPNACFSQMAHGDEKPNKPLRAREYEGTHKLVVLEFATPKNIGKFTNHKLERKSAGPICDLVLPTATNVLLDRAAKHSRQVTCSISDYVITVAYPDFWWHIFKH